MRGVSTVVVVIIILMIIVALAALSYTFFVGIFQAASQSGTEAIGRAATAGQALMRIESVSENKIYIRNIGQVDLSNISVYVGDTSIYFTIAPSTVSPGDTATITFASAPAGDIAVTSGEGALSIYAGYAGYYDAPPAAFWPWESSATYSPGKTYRFNITVNDDKDISIVLFRWTTSANTSISSYTDYNSTAKNYSASKTDLAVATYSYYWFANDSADQWTSLSDSYTVTKAASTVYLYVNKSRANFAGSLNSVVNFTSQMSTPSSGNVELWTNFSNGVWKRWVGPAASPLINYTTMTVAGVWNWTANYTGNQNYSADIETWLVTIT